jgi:PAS domain S-box-containing protein
MASAPRPADEASRLAALQDLHVLDSPPEERFDRITRLAGRLLHVPIALVSLIDAERQWVKSCSGHVPTELPRDGAICSHTILTDEALIVEDARHDPRFVDNPLVVDEPYVRFYAGVPLHAPNGKRVGTLSVLDREPRSIGSDDLQTLRDLAEMVERELGLPDIIRLMAAIAESEERAISFMDGLPDAIVIFFEDGSVIRMNRPGRHLFDRDPATATFKVQELFEGERGSVLRELIAIAQTPDSGAAMVARAAGGAPFPVEVTGAKVGRSVPQRYGVIIRDVTERRRAEDELRAAYARTSTLLLEAEAVRGEQRAVLDAAGEAMALVAADRRFLSVNRRFRELFDVAEDEVVGHRFGELAERVDRIFADPETFKQRVAGTASNEQDAFSFFVEQRWPLKRELELYSTPVRAGNGRFLGRLYVLRDVTREREVDRMKSEFVSMVSHELRTPLTSIKGYVDLLLEVDTDNLTADQRGFLEIVKTSADRLVALINDLLDVSRIEAGKIELRREAVDVARLIREVVNAFRPQLETKQQHLTQMAADDLPLISADADRVTQVLTNLISNAHKYTPRGGSIVVRASPQGAGARVEVQDSGIGLSEQEQKQIFDRFFRANNRVAREAGGTGLGLTIARALVEMHGGEISFSSAPGSGSIFAFTLPTPATTEPAPLLMDGTPVGRNILVVDDEPDIASLIQRYLEGAGHHVSVATTAAEALLLARELQPHLITLDIMLPDMDGVAVLEQLKADPQTAAIPVLLLSVLPDPAEGRLLGAVDYLAKPIRQELLVERVRRILIGGGERLILVADDELEIRALMAEHLRHAGYRVVEAEDGETAVRLARERSPALVLMDVRMPAMGGVEAVRVLRLDPMTRNLPVVLMTASPSVFDEEQSTIEELTGTRLLSKPCTAQELVESIASGLSRMEAP